MVKELLALGYLYNNVCNDVTCAGMPMTCHRDYKRIESALRDELRDKLNKSTGGGGENLGPGCIAMKTNIPNFIQYSKLKIQDVQGHPALIFNIFAFVFT